MENYTPKHEDKFLVYCTDTCGMGDRLLGITSTFLLAVANGYQFRIKNFEPYGLAEVFTSALPWWSDDWIYNHMKRGRMNIESDVWSYSNLLTEGLISQHYPNAKCINVHSNQNFIGYLFENYNYISELTKYGITPENAFQKAVEYLFKFETGFEENYKYLKSQLKSSDKYIGVHVRTNRKWGDVPQISEGCVERFLDATESEYKKGNKVFICSDDQDVVNKFKNRFGSDVVALPGEAKHLEKSKEQTLQEFSKILFEIWLLADSDVFIGSYWSNFSRLVTLKQVKDPILVELELAQNPQIPTQDWINGRVDENGVIDFEKEYGLNTKIKKFLRSAHTEMSGIK